MNEWCRASFRNSTQSCFEESVCAWTTTTTTGLFSMVEIGVSERAWAWAWAFSKEPHTETERGEFRFFTNCLNPSISLKEQTACLWYVCRSFSARKYISFDGLLWGAGGGGVCLLACPDTFFSFLHPNFELRWYASADANNVFRKSLCKKMQICSSSSP
jgi:hypothetical protein